MRDIWRAAYAEAYRRTEGAYVDAVAARLTAASLCIAGVHVDEPEATAHHRWTCERERRIEAAMDRRGIEWRDMAP